MLILIHGSLGLDYLIHSVLPSGNWLLSTICTEGGGNSGIDMKLSPGISARLAIAWGRILELRNGDAVLLLDALLSSETLRDAVNYVLEMHTEYGADRLYYFMRILESLSIWKPISKGCIVVPQVEPIRSLISSLVLAYMAGTGVKGSVVLATDFVDELSDMLQEVRGFGDIYVFTNHMPRSIAVFDEAFVSSTTVPQETFGKLIRVSNGDSTEVLMKRLGSGINNNNFEAVKVQLSDVELEILRTINELGFTTMASLIDMVSQSMGVTKNDVIKALIRVSSMNLVRIRYLADGRAIVTPTLPGFKLLMPK